MDRAEIGQVLRKLVATDGPSGGESRIATVVQALCAPYATDVRADVMGSVVAHRAGATLPAPGRIMLAAHMDEIGLLVTKVEGTFLHVTAIGGVDPRTAIGQEVTVYATGPGCERYPDGLPGYLGGRPPHLLSGEERAKVVPMGDLRVDLGFPPAGCVLVGDRAVWRGPYTELLGGRVAAKSLDNRASLAAMIGALGYLAQGRHTWDVYAVATVQEEVGLRGARASGFTLAPDIAVAIDVTFADTPGVNEEQTAPMDKGPSLAWGPNLHPGLVGRLRAAAEALEMNYTMDPIPGASGTDAWALQLVREGLPCGLVGIPIRYMHSPVEVVALNDIDRAARLLAAFVSRLDDTVLASLAEEV